MEESRGEEEFDWPIDWRVARKRVQSLLTLGTDDADDLLTQCAEDEGDGDKTDAPECSLATSVEATKSTATSRSCTTMRSTLVRSGVEKLMHDLDDGGTIRLETFTSRKVRQLLRHLFAALSLHVADQRIAPGVLPLATAFAKPSEMSFSLHRLLVLKLLPDSGRDCPIVAKRKATEAEGGGQEKVDGEQDVAGKKEERERKEEAVNEAIEAALKDLRGDADSHFTGALFHPRDEADTRSRKLEKRNQPAPQSASELSKPSASLPPTQSLAEMWKATASTESSRVHEEIREFRDEANNERDRWGKRRQEQMRKGVSKRELSRKRDTHDNTGAEREHHDWSGAIEAIADSDSSSDSPRHSDSQLQSNSSKNKESRPVGCRPRKKEKIDENIDGEEPVLNWAEQIRGGKAGGQGDDQKRAKSFLEHLSSQKLFLPRPTPEP